MELFADLESNNVKYVEEAKRKFVETFSQNKEPILVHGVMDYFVHTNSMRAVDVLVKVQAPHDRIIFDRMYEWLRSPNKQHALNLFGHIVRKHPTWLYKVANHQLMKDLMKLLKSEKDIILLMGTLLCIINLMPIIPSSMALHLQDLFDGFAHLASIPGQSSTKFSNDLLIHLQIGLHCLFNRLYGMFPCNFLAFLRKEYVIKEKTAIYTHTIKPLLDTVKINPLLVTTDKELEMNNARWKKMEPHDVVFECSKFSLDFLARPEGIGHEGGGDCQCHHVPSSRLLTTTSTSHQTSFEYGSSLMETLVHSFKSVTVSESSRKPTLLSMARNERFIGIPSQESSIWSPSKIVLATPPPTGVPHTPTAITTTNYSVQIGQQDGSSPPEAAVEATPETTPMKDPLLRALPSNSSAVRAIWRPTGATPTSGGSTPSSPMRKELSPFRFPESSVVASEQPATLSGVTSTQKIIRMVNERNLSIKQIQSPGGISIESGINPQLVSNIVVGGEINVGAATSIPNSPLPTDIFVSSNLADSCSTQEDQEVNEINRSVQTQEITILPDFSTDCDVDCESEVSPCSAGGLHIIDSKSMIDFARGRMRMYSHCIGDSSFSAGTSPADVSNFIEGFGSNKGSLVKKSSSWPDLKSLSQTSSPSYFMPFSQTKYGKEIAAANGREIIAKDSKAIAEIIIAKTNTETQTLQQWPQFYEHMFLGIFLEEQQKRQLAETQKTLAPYEMLDQYIAASIKKKHSIDNRNWEEMYKDQIQLLVLQLQYERHRREVHAERNRRLLGKSRTNRGFEQQNATLRDQVHRLSADYASVQTDWMNCRKMLNQREQDLIGQTNTWKTKYQNELDENKKLRMIIANLKEKIADESKSKKDIHTDLESARGELFDIRNEMRQALYQADLGQQYKQELTRLQSEMILMGELQLKCKEKLGELHNLKMRDEELEILHTSYTEEVKDLRVSLEIKSSQLDAAKSRLMELEAQLSRRDSMFTDQKRLLKAVKEEYHERLKSLEQKYLNQKSLILRMEEHILELNKNHSAVNLPTLSPESDKDVVGSLDPTSPLSISLASSDGGLSTSVHSELKNLQVLVGKQTSATTAATMAGGSFLQSENNQLGASTSNVSEDITIPGPSHSSHRHHHHHHHHH